MSDQPGSSKPGPAGKAALAAGIPLVIMTAIGIMLLVQGDAANGRSTLAVGVIVAAVSGSVFVYQVPSWSLKQQSAVHLGIMLVTVLPALLASGWFDLTSPGGWFAAVGVFAAWGVVLWIVLYLVFTAIDRRRASARGVSGGGTDQVR